MRVNLDSVEMGLDVVTLEGGDSLLARVVDCNHEVGIREQDQLHCLLQQATLALVEAHLP